MPWLLFDRYDRLWSDLDAAIVQYTAVALSLRSVSAVLELQSGQVVSIGTVQRRVAGAAVVAAQVLAEPLTAAPAVVMLDGLWGTFMADTGERRLDKKGRRRKVKQKQKVPVLLAYGVDPVTGERGPGVGTGEDGRYRCLGMPVDHAVRAWRAVRDRAAPVHT